MIRCAALATILFGVAVAPAMAGGSNIPPPTDAEMQIFKNRAELVLGHHLDDYYFMGQDPGPPPRPGCILDKRVKDPHVPNLWHAGWKCPKLH
ncbi:MAG TPA: hypothetical protein VG753_02840 [Candidatus Paceibacterota bacterium]|nr:hypothetical protein [Candidatus Paceibacterota bacterium]